MIILLAEMKGNNMGEEPKCEAGNMVKNPPRATIVLNYSDEVVLIRGNNKFTLRIDSDGHLLGTQEKEIKL